MSFKFVSKMKMLKKIIHFQTHQQSMKSLINNKNGKDAHWSTIILNINFDVILCNCNWNNILLIFINTTLSKI